MSGKSRILDSFIEEIKNINRNPRNTRALELLSEMESNSEIELPVGFTMYRSRIIHKSERNRTNKKTGFFGFDEKNSFVTPPEKTSDMRANYRYIPYLYCSNNAYISVAEIRPKIGADISVATIKTKETVKLLDFTLQNTPKKKMLESKRNLFNELSFLYSKPITDDEDVIEYIPTQYIAEYVKNLGYDGIAFSSSQVPDVNKASLPRYNIVLFNYYKAQVIKSNVVTVTNNIIEIEEKDGDKSLDVRNRVEEMLTELF